MSGSALLNGKQRTYLVTGAAGFIGARFVESCQKRGIRVIPVDHPDHFTARDEHGELGFGNSSRGGEIVDRENLFDWLGEKKPTLSAIVHLGACSDTTQMDEAYFKRVNVDYSKSIWNYASEHSIPLVYASSAATYGNGEHGYSDDEALTGRLKPLNPYGRSKLEFDLWALDQERKGTHPPSWSGWKFFNVYGFGERHKTKMASIVLKAYDQILDRGTVRLFKSHKPGIGDGQQSRDFIHVNDVVEVLHFALEKPIARGIFNLGTGVARTFLDLVSATFRAMNREPEIEFVDTPPELRNQYQYFTQAEMRRLRDEGYSRPFTSLEDGVAEYVSRLREFYGKA